VRREEPSESLRIRQREREVQRLALIRKPAAERVGEHAPHRRAVRCRNDTDGGAAADAEDTPELGETRAGSGKNCKPSWHSTASNVASQKGSVLAVAGDERDASRAGP
jgi:hypothetical protein